MDEKISQMGSSQPLISMPLIVDMDQVGIPWKDFLPIKNPPCCINIQ